jgi:hypothetical protein
MQDPSDFAKQFDDIYRNCLAALDQLSFDWLRNGTTAFPWADVTGALPAIATFQAAELFGQSKAILAGLCTDSRDALLSWPRRGVGGVEAEFELTAWIEIDAGTDGDSEAGIISVERRVVCALCGEPLVEAGSRFRHCSEVVIVEQVAVLPACPKCGRLTPEAFLSRLAEIADTPLQLVLLQGGGEGDGSGRSLLRLVGTSPTAQSLDSPAPPSS